MGRGIINKRSREPVKNGERWRRKTKALCKLNNDHENKEPWQLFEFEKYFSNSIW